MSNDEYLVSLQTLDFDREGLTKLKKAIKAIHNSGNGKSQKYAYIHVAIIFYFLFFFIGKNKSNSYVKPTTLLAYIRIYGYSSCLVKYIDYLIIVYFPRK